MNKHVLQFGILAGVIIFTYSLGVFFFYGDFSRLTPAQLSQLKVLGYLRYIILFLGVFLGMRAFRKSLPPPHGFWQMTKTGILIALLVAVFVGAMEFIYIRFMNPEFYDEYGKVFIEGMRESGEPEQKIAEAQQGLESFSWMRNPVLTGIFYFFETLIVGSIAAAPFGLFLRSRTSRT